MTEEYQNDLKQYSSANSSSYARKMAASAGKENKTASNFFQSKPKNGVAGDAKPFQVGFSFLPSIDGANRAAAWPATDPQVPARKSALRTPAGQSQKQTLHQQQKRDYALEKRDYVQGAGQRALDAVTGMGSSVQPSHSVAARKAAQPTRWRVKGEGAQNRAAQQDYGPHEASAYQAAQQRARAAGGQQITSLPRRDLVRGQRDKQLDELNETLQRLAREKQEALGGKITVHTVKRKVHKPNQYRNDGQLDPRVVDGYFYEDQMMESKKKKKKSRKHAKGEPAHTPYNTKPGPEQWSQMAPMDLEEEMPESQRGEMKQAAPTQGPARAQGGNTAAHATPSGSDLRIYKLGRGAIKLKPGTELAQANLEHQGSLSPAKQGLPKATTTDGDYDVRYAGNAAQSLPSSSAMKDTPDESAFRGAQEVTSIRISPLEGPAAVSFHITMSGGGEGTQNQTGGHERRSTEVSRSNDLAKDHNPKAESSVVINRAAATSSLLPKEADPLRGITSDVQGNQTFDNKKNGNKPLELQQLALKPSNASASPTKRLNGEDGYPESASLRTDPKLDPISIESRSSQNDLEDLARQLPTPRGGAEGAVYPGGGQRPGSKADLNRDRTQAETFKAAAEKLMLRNKTPSQIISSNNGSQAQQRNKGPLDSIEAIATDQMIRLDSLGKTSSKFSSQAKNSSKPRPELHTATKFLNTQRNHDSQPSLTEQQIEVDSGDCSSQAEERIKTLRLGRPIKTKREHQSACQQYCQYRGHQLPKQYRSTFTPNKFRKPDDDTVYSQRLFLSQECAQSEDRRMLPVLIVNLDGAVGYWGDNQTNFYVLREGVLDSLIQMSHDFRIVAVSSQRQKLIFKLIYGLMNMPAPDQTVDQDVGTLRRLFFDAVYQLNSSCPNDCSIKSLDQTQFDLTQVLVDMQFKRQQISKPEEQIQPDGQTTGFLTFWESPHYKPHTKVLIFTTEQYLNQNECYSFDYHHLFQAYGFQQEDPYKSPIVLQIPHLRVNPKVSFRIVHQLIFALQNITQVICLSKQNQNQPISESVSEEAIASSFDVCKKLLSAKWRGQEYKLKHGTDVKGVGVFDPNSAPYINLSMIDFSQSYKIIKSYFTKKSSNWLRVQKYRLLSKPSKEEQRLARKMKTKVTFVDEPQIIQMGVDEAHLKVAFDISTMNEGSMEEKALRHAKATNYASEEAKNAYNSLILRNATAKEDIKAYAKHLQDKEKYKQFQEQQRSGAKKSSHAPLPLGAQSNQEYATEGVSALSQPATFSNLRSCFNPYPKEEKEEKSKQLVKDKPYAYKYRALVIKSGQTGEEEKELRLQAVDLNMTDINQAAFEKVFVLNSSSKPAAQQELVQMAQTNSPASINKSDADASFLIDLLSKRQRQIPFTMSQALHLQSGLDQLAGGEEQYYKQEEELKGREADSDPNSLPKGTSKSPDYIDLI